MFYRRLKYRYEFGAYELKHKWANTSA